MRERALAGPKRVKLIDKYLQRMSNYCAGCRWYPVKATGKDACPFTTLYWDFLMRHEPRLRQNPGMTMQLNHLVRLDHQERAAIQRSADGIGKRCKAA